ncbi:MAG: hypothetical protein RL654_1203 [Pseudomonadota bacterium]|jgi:hypothetical protein
MATEAGARTDRRRLLLGSVLGCVLPWMPARASSSPGHGQWVSAWNDQGAHRVGLLQRAAEGWRVATSIEVPTRAHGLTVLPDGSVIAVARRPGDWLLRWWPAPGGRETRAPRWRWAPAGRQFNGHAVLHPDGRHLLLTATDTEADDGLGRGLLMLMRLDRLEPVAEAPTLGRDPHQLLIVPEAAGLRLWVANGGIASRPESGRARLIDAPMDASVALFALQDASDTLPAAPERRWTLDDPWLSLRHLAWHAPSATLGIAMQAEHPQPTERRAAPVLALLDTPAPSTGPADAARLRVVRAEADLAGYGGDIVATAAGFGVSSPKTGRIAHWQADGQWLGSQSLAQGCALESAADGQRLQAAGERLTLDEAGAIEALPVQPDNHWQRWPRPR